MKNTFFTGIALVISILGVVRISEATLLQITSNVLLDDTSGIYWINDIHFFGQGEWLPQYNTVTSFSGLADSRWDAWEIASQDDFINLSNSYTADEVVEAFNLYPDTIPGHGMGWTLTPMYAANSDGQYSENWYGGVYDLERYGGTRYDYRFGTGSEPMGVSGFGMGIWVVADATPIPEPSTILLLNLGLISLWQIKRFLYSVPPERF